MLHCVCRPTAPTDTLRRVPSLYIRPAQNTRGRVYEYIPLLWCVNVIWGSIQFVSADPAGNTCARLSRVLVDDVPGVEVGGGETQNSDNYGNDRGGFVVVLPGYIYLSFRARDDATFWTGECDLPSFLTATNDA